MANTYPSNSHLTWKGISWWIDDTSRLDSRNGYVDDAGNLHMLLKITDGVYKGFKLEGPQIRHGRLTWVAQSTSLNFPFGSTVGLFTYYSDSSEIDIEIHQWYATEPRLNFCNQPASIDDYPQNVHQAVTNDSKWLTATGITYVIEWTPSYIYYSATASDGTIIEDWTYTIVASIPQVNHTVCIDFMPRAGSTGPAGTDTYELILSDYSYNDMVIAANFSAPTRTGTTNTTFSFSDTSTGLPRTWLWNFGDGTTSTAQNPTHRYTSPGTYTVTLTATNAVSNDTETKSAYITVASTGGTTPVTYPTNGKLTWKGIEWNVRSYAGNPGGDDNQWLTNGAYIDSSGRLHLTITKEGATFYSSELCSPTKYLYGVFRWRIETPLNDLDPNVCLAGFTYLNDTTEIDIEYSKWQYDTRELWYSNQPTTSPGYQIEQAQPIIGEIDWSPSRIIFSSWYADGTLIAQYQMTTDIPDEDSYFLLQCWLVDPASGTASGGNLDFVFSDFTINPTSDTVFTPVANFTANITSGTAPLTVQFSDTSTNTPTSWAWNFGDGTSSTSRNPSHQYSTAGSYTVTLTATNAAGSDTETKTAYVTVTAPTLPSVPILENIVRNPNFEAWSNGTSEAAPDGWVISDDTTTTGGLFRSNDGATGSYSLGIVGDGIQRLRGHVLCFPQVTAAPVKMDAWVKRVGSATGGIQLFCWNGADNYKSVLANEVLADTWTHVSWDLATHDAIDYIEVDIYSIEYAVGTWLVDNVQVSCEVPVYDMDETISASNIQNQFTYNPTGEYTTSNICVNFLTYPLTDYDVSSITATIDGSSRTVWYRGNYVYIDTSGLDTSPHAVVIQANRNVESVSPVANFTADQTSGTEPLTVTFTDTSTNSPTSWLWSFGDGGTSTERNPTHVYLPGTYTVSLTGTNAAGSDSETKTDYITVTAAESAPTAAFSANTTSGDVPLTVTFTDSSTGNPTSWLWNFGDGTTSTDRNPVHTYTISGTYTVTLTVSNTAGSDSETKTGYITVAAKSVAYWFWYWFSRLWR